MQEAARDHAVTILTGARQVGKSTLLLNAEPFCRWRFHSLDDFDALRQSQKEPEALWAGTRRVVIDEVQKAPGLLTAVKQAVDRHPGKYRFSLSGSANLMLMKQITESLAGRAVYFVLDPMTRGETGRKSPPSLLKDAMDGKMPAEGRISDTLPDPASLVFRGLMPGLLTLQTPESRLRWWDGYVATYLERDLRQLSQIDALVDFRRMMGLAALRCGQLLNQSEIARDAGLSQATAHRYLNVLEASHMFERLSAYTASRTARLVKSPKAFWNDTGLAVFLSGYYSEQDLRKCREYGAFFETLIFHHLRVLTRLMAPPARLYYWRTRSGVECDFVIEHGRRVLAVEAKMTRHPKFADAAALHHFLQMHPDASGGLLLHCGEQILRLGKNIAAIPWTMVSG